VRGTLKAARALPSGELGGVVAVLVADDGVEALDQFGEALESLLGIGGRADARSRPFGL
jgi:hypothetical protein